MSGTSPLKDQLVHNNLAHKLLFWSASNDGGLAFAGEEICSDEGIALVDVCQQGFSVTASGAEFILARLARDVLSHREVKIMKDMTRPVPAPKASPATEIAPELVNPDPNLSLAGLF